MTGNIKKNLLTKTFVKMHKKTAKKDALKRR